MMRFILLLTFVTASQLAPCRIGSLQFCQNVLAQSTTTEAIDAPARKFLKQFCADCHGDGADEGGFEIQFQNIDGSKAETRHAWEQIHLMVSRSIMPPADADQPSDQQRQQLLDAADRFLLQHSPIGGTQLRRLNRREFAKTIERLFGINGYNVPHSFPPDNTQHGFDTQAESLVLAGSHLEALNDAAINIADQIFPPPKKTVSPGTFSIPATDMVISYSSACLIDGSMRLASSGDNVVRNATWPTKFEAPASGIYRLTIRASAILPTNGDAVPQPILTVATMRASDRGELTMVDEIEISDTPNSPIELNVPLTRGDTVALRYKNGPLDYEDVDEFKTFLMRVFSDDPRLAAAWNSIGNPPRGGSGWARVKQAMQNQELDVAPFIGNEQAVADLVDSVAKNKVNSGETIVYKFFDEGPAIAIESMKLHGPVEFIRDRQQIRSDQLRIDLVGKDFDPDHSDSLRQFLERFLSDAFRRPATQGEVQKYLDLVKLTRSNGGSKDEAMHLVIRQTILSPAFLYRGFTTGPLNDDDLATRLSYFLTAGPPSKQLRKTAAAGKLIQSPVLQREADRIMGREFSREFSTQWLGTDEVDRLMPDMRLTTKFSDKHRRTVRDEVTETFHHILSENLSVTDFIDPDFVFTDQAVGRDIYALESLKQSRKNRASKAQRNKITKFKIPRGSRHGGLLSMAAVMMSAANGVDTQPVLRGVWVLDNIFGSPPPEPPDAVPALTPDTSNATTVRERLAAHMSDASCAQCHREIDPVGFALENFDPIGRWREFYPKYVQADGKIVTREGASVQSDGVLPDGTVINDVTDLKKWLAANPEIFARCLSVKLLTYATGRELNYRERSLVADIVHDQRTKNDLRFRDLLLALIDSEIFRTK